MFSATEAQQKQWEATIPKLATREELKNDVKNAESNFQLECMRTKSAEDTLHLLRLDNLRKEIDEQQGKVTQQLEAVFERLRFLETENATLKAKQSVQPQPSELHDNILLAQSTAAHRPENSQAPCLQHASISEVFARRGTVPSGNPRSEVCPEISSFLEIPELHLRSEMPNSRQKTGPLRLINFDDLLTTF